MQQCSLLTKYGQQYTFRTIEEGEIRLTPGASEEDIMVGVE